MHYLVVLKISKFTLNNCFDVLLTVHLGIILVINQLKAQSTVL